MKRILVYLLAAGLVLLVGLSIQVHGRGGRGGGGGGRGGGGGGGRGGGGFQGGYSAPARPQPARTASPSAARSGVGPAGGTWDSGQRSGSYTTQRGSTVDYRGAGVGGTTAGGTTGGRYVGGVQVTTPSGQTVNRASRGGAATGPGGVTVGGRGSITQATGPGGTATAASRGAAAVGPGGAVAGRAGAAVGPGGAVAGRAGAAVGPGGAVAGRTGAAATARGTYYRTTTAVAGQGAYVRQGFAQQYPVLAARWAGPTWRPITWAALATYGGYPAEPSYYDYGTNVVYQGDTVYIDGEPATSTEQYAEKAVAIAEQGQQAQAAEGEKWQPVGVFASVPGEETTAYNIFRLEINKAGVLRGDYYNALTDASETVAGSVDRSNQRAAWTVGGRKFPVYETGVANLALESTAMMVHFSKDRSQQFTLFRLEPPSEEGKK